LLAYGKKARFGGLFYVQTGRMFCKAMRLKKSNPTQGIAAVRHCATADNPLCR